MSGNWLLHLRSALFVFVVDVDKDTFIHMSLTWWYGSLQSFQTDKIELL
jgi:hypothetical protein